MTAGTANNPWKAWIILTAALLQWQGAIPLADVLNEKLWDELGKQRIYGQQASLTQLEAKYGQDRSLLDATYYALWNGSLYVLPGFLLVYSLINRLPPYMFVVFIALNAVLLCVVEGLASTHWYIYKYMTFALIAMQLTGILGFVTLWLYRGTVQKIEPEEPEL